MMVSFAALFMLLLMFVFVAGVAVAILWTRHRRQHEQRGFEVKPVLPLDESGR